ncbi:MAG: DUF354 domain-containing protein [Bacteroidota bacterium]
MKILIDIGHPAHVHYFRNFIQIMEEKENKFLVIARDKEVTFSLLNFYQIPFKSSGKAKKSIFGKFIKIFLDDFNMLFWVLKFKPDILLSFAGGPNRIGKLLGIRSITFDDTEHAKLSHMLYLKHSTHIVTPSCYLKSFPKKQISYNGYMELCYLHSKYYTPNISTLKDIGINEGEKFAILRFVSWNASHDIGHSGLTIDMKRELVNILSKHVKIYISSEATLPEEFQQYQIKVAPEKMHDILAFATIFIGEGATMASECAMLGTPAIYVNSLSAGTLEEQEKYGLISSHRGTEGVLEKTKEFLEMINLKEVFQSRREKMLSEKIDVTAFMVWLVDNYPQSAKIMEENPKYQLQFLTYNDN